MVGMVSRAVTLSSASRQKGCSFRSMSEATYSTKNQHVLVTKNCTFLNVSNLNKMGFLLPMPCGNILTLVEPSMFWGVVGRAPHYEQSLSQTASDCSLNYPPDGSTERKHCLINFWLVPADFSNCLKQAQSQSDVFQVSGDVFATGEKTCCGRTPGS
jgi:hypothetical protein